MKSSIKILLASFCMALIFSASFAPVFVQAKILSGIIPCGNSSIGATPAQIKAEECNFGDLLALGQNIIRTLVLLSIPITAIAFCWAGFLYLSSGGDTSKIKQAKEIFWKVMWGFIFILTAWLIVYAATSLLAPGFSFLFN